MFKKGDIIKVRNTGYYEIVKMEKAAVRYKRIMSTNRFFKNYRKTHICNEDQCEHATVDEIEKVKTKVTEGFDKIIQLVQNREHN